MTFFLEIYTAFRDYNRNIAVYIAFAMFVEKRYGNIGVGYALNEGHTKYSLRSICVTTSCQ